MKSVHQTVGEGRGKAIPGIGNSVFEGNEAGNSMVYLEKRNVGTCVPLLRTPSSTQHWTSTGVKRLWVLTGKI